MKPENQLQISVLIGRGAHPQAVVDDLWNRALAVADQGSFRVTGTVVYMHDGESAVAVADERVSVVAIAKRSPGRITGLVSDAARMPGPVGVAGRLARDNIESRRFAGAVAGRPGLLDTLCGSDMVVAADLIADRSVWQLRQRTGAKLVHGPIAMVHVLRQMAST